MLHGEMVHTQRFRSPLDLTGMIMSDVTLQMQQVIGIPANDGKQQLILAGIPGCGCTGACPNCTSQRVKWNNPSERLWKIMVERKLETGACPHKDAPKRTGNTSQDKNAE